MFIIWNTRICWRLFSKKFCLFFSLISNNWRVRCVDRLLKLIRLLFNIFFWRIFLWRLFLTRQKNTSLRLWHINWVLDSPFLSFFRCFLNQLLGGLFYWRLINILIFLRFNFHLYQILFRLFHILFRSLSMIHIRRLSDWIGSLGRISQIFVQS